jgi:hypothetical protein
VNLCCDAEGRVGIRKADPTFTLDVWGDINFSGGLYYQGQPYNPSGSGVVGPKGDRGDPGPVYVLPNMIDLNVVRCHQINIVNPGVDYNGNCMYLASENVAMGSDTVYHQMLKICPYPLHPLGWSQAFHALGYSWQINDSTTWAQRSDRRLKTNIKTLGSGMDKILQLNPVTFDWKLPTAHANITAKVGFIAQEFQQVFPEKVHVGVCADEEVQFVNVLKAGEPSTNTAAETDCLSIIDSDLTPYLVKAIQEMAEKIIALELAVEGLRHGINTVDKAKTNSPPKA